VRLTGHPSSGSNHKSPAGCTRCVPRRRAAPLYIHLVLAFYASLAQAFGRCAESASSQRSANSKDAVNTIGAPVCRLIRLPGCSRRARSRPEPKGLAQRAHHQAVRGDTCARPRADPPCSGCMNTYTVRAGTQLELVTNANRVGEVRSSKAMVCAMNRLDPNRTSGVGRTAAYV
jgi:hypothetical protein